MGMSAVACYQRNGKTGNLEMLAIDMTGKTDTMQVTDKHRQGTGTGRASCWVTLIEMSVCRHRVAMFRVSY
jgi:hypothetical protein